MALAVGLGSALALSGSTIALAQQSSALSDDPAKVKLLPPVESESTSRVEIEIDGTTRSGVLATGTVSDSYSRSITPPGGSAATATVGFSSPWTSSWGVTTGTITIGNGRSWARWLGSNPFNANSVSLNNSVWVTGVNITISVPPSLSASVSNNTVSFGNSVSNNWRNEHYFSNIRFSTHVYIYGPYESASSAMRFGSTTFYLNT
nr:hypothetical protein [Micromonospora sp. DSM 115978]